MIDSNKDFQLSDMTYGETAEGVAFVIWGVNLKRKPFNGSWWVYTKQELVNVLSRFEEFVIDEQGFKNFVQAAMQNLPQVAPEFHTRNYDKKKEFSFTEYDIVDLYHKVWEK